MSIFVNFGQTEGFGVPGRENDRAADFREIHLSNGQTVTIKTEGPNGFWFVKWNKGATPDALRGAYTTASLALRALEIYIEGNKHNTKVVEEKVELPKIQYKKVPGKQRLKEADA